MTPSVPETAAEVIATPVADAPRPASDSILSKFEQHVSIIERRVATQDQSPPCPVNQAALPLARISGPHGRNGKIARLPKLERDMVNRMLRNNLPHSKIVGALGELGICVTQRNVSNWKTSGGYKEWCAEQERQLQLALMQDSLTDYLRKNDASQLPEVGLQVAATQLSSMLLQPEAVQQLTAEPEKYSKVVEMLCRLSTHIHSLQKDRNEAVKKASIRGTSEHFRREDEKAVEEVRSVFSSKIGEGPRDPDILHRNDLPERDALPFQEPPPKAPSFMEKVEYVRRIGRSLPGIPAPKAKTAENPAAAEKTVPANGSANSAHASPSPGAN